MQTGIGEDIGLLVNDVVMVEEMKYALIDIRSTPVCLLIATRALAHDLLDIIRRPETSPACSTNEACHDHVVFVEVE